MTVEYPGSETGRGRSPDRTTFDQKYVQSLFDRIAYRYDFLNHALSAGVDIWWRRKAVRILREFHPATILDVATGTGDLAIEVARLNAGKIVGIDISSQMLGIARKKLIRHNLTTRVELIEGSAEQLQLADESFDAVTVAFGVRNFSDLTRGLSEMRRVLRPGGVALILEFSRPRHAPLKHVYQFYFRRILPVVGGFISRSREAYEYLPRTVENFPDGENFVRILQSVGFPTVRQYPLTFGIATIYLAHKEIEEKVNVA